MSNPIRSISLLAMALCISGTLAHAQDAGVFFGVGYATDKSIGSASDYITGLTELAPKLDNTYGKIGGDIMFNKRYGFNAEADFQFSKTNYLGFNVRPSFYDVNGVYVPFSGRWNRVVPEILGGIGGAHLSFTTPSCNSLTGCQTVALGASSHFLVHVGAAVNIYATKHIFIRPAFDYRYVPNFFQYGSNSVPEYGAAVGWSFTEH